MSLTHPHTIFSDLNFYADGTLKLTSKMYCVQKCVLVTFQAGPYIPGVRTGIAGWGVGHSRSRQGTRTGWLGHCWRQWCLTGWARAGRGDTWRFLWAARWQSGDSFLENGERDGERAMIKLSAGHKSLYQYLFLLTLHNIYEL